MADDQFPTPEFAIETIVGIVKGMREKGGTVEEQKSAIKAKLLDPKFVRQQSRTEVLTNVNHKLGTKYSMSQIKAAKTIVLEEPVAPAAAAPASIPANPIPVAELHGSATVDMAASQEHPEPKFKMTDLPGDKGVVVKVIEDHETLKDDTPVNADIVVGGRRDADTELSRENGSSEPIFPPTGHHFSWLTLEEKIVAHQQERIKELCPEVVNLTGYRVNDTTIEYTGFTAEADIIEIVMNAQHELISKRNISQERRDQLAQNTAQQTNQTQSANTEEDTMTNANAHTTANNNNAAKDFDGFIMFLSSKGMIDGGLRTQVFLNFMEGQPEVMARWATFSASAPADMDSDHRIYNFLESEQEFTKSYMGYLLTQFKIEDLTEGAAAAKSRFSLMNERDEGVRSSWIGVGAAVVGGGMEMAARGGLTVGSALGTVAGAIGSFFAGELIDSNIESQFGRYVAAGTAGLALGAVGSAVGRSLLPGNNLLGNAAEPSALDVDPSVVSGMIGAM